jgi:hypothetical protein
MSSLARSLTVRILGLQVSQEEVAPANISGCNKVSVKNVYDCFLKPIFNPARTKRLITTVPQINIVIAKGFSHAKDKKGYPYPAPHLTDMSLRKAFFMCKKKALVLLAAVGAIPIIVEDLTTATLNMMIYRLILISMNNDPCVIHQIL